MFYKNVIESELAEIIAITIPVFVVFGYNFIFGVDKFNVS